MDIAKSEYGSPAPLENFLRSTHSNVSHPGGMPNISLSGEQIRTILPTSAACAKRTSFSLTSTAGAMFHQGRRSPRTCDLQQRKSKS